MIRCQYLALAALAALAVPTAASAGGPPCGCAAPLGGTVDLEFAGCPCGVGGGCLGGGGCAPACAAPAYAAPCGPVCAAPAAVYAAPACGCAAPVAPAYGYGACGCDNYDYTRRPGCGGCGPGLFSRMWEFEKRKNRFLFGGLCDKLRGDCQPVYAPVCAPVCEPCAPACAAPAYGAGFGGGFAAPAADCGCGH